MTPYEANHYFETLPEGFAPAEELRAALPAAVQQVQFVGVAGTAGKTATAGLLGAILQAAGFVTGLYHAGCEPLPQCMSRKVALQMGILHFLSLLQ